MKLRYSIVLLCLLKVVCSYPSTESDTQHEKIFSSCEMVHPAVSLPLMYLDDSPTENNFPDVVYPTKMLVDTIEPFFYHAADHDDILGPFTSDVKESFKSLEAERKLKEHTSYQDCNAAAAELNIQRVAKENDASENTDSLYYNVQNSEQNLAPLLTNDTIVFETDDSCQSSDEKDVVAYTDLNDSNEDKPYVELSPADAEPAPVTTHDDSLESKQSEETVSINVEHEHDM